MRIPLTTLLVLTLCISKPVGADDSEKDYVDEWAAEIPGGWDQAKQVAEQHGYTVLQQIPGFDDFYVLHRSDVPRRARRGAHHHTRKLVEDYRVRYVAQQQEQIRVKRSLVSRSRARSIVQEDGTLDDPELYHEWYLNHEDSSTSRRDTVRADLKVKDVWRRGVTGKGVVVTILDDGLERTHPDLKDNYDADASFDFNDNDTDPSPRYDITNENKHGTRCGGEIAMVANNNKCGVGIAFDSRIGGVRMLDGRITDRLEGSAIAFNRNHIDIYSASWGPNDDGRTVEGPGLMAARAFELGITKGREGKGSLYVWASGNGGRIGDNCNADGYTSSIYTLSVSSASQFGNSPWYSEKCASTLTTTYSSGGSKEGKVTSADLHGQCTNAHTGTSAAAPMAAGVLALLLEVNPKLTWRDVQHIVAQTSRMEPLALEKGWYRNGAGYCVNLAFGFGLMDALGIVELGNPSSWTSVGEQHICSVESGGQKEQFPQKLHSGGMVEVEFRTDGCKGQANEVGFLEHVQVVFSVDYPRRGNIYAELESPLGTITPLMLERKYDTSRFGFKDWPLMTVHNWGERPQGTWKFRVADRSDDHMSGHVRGAVLYLHGTKEQPEYRKSAESKDCGDVQTFAVKLHSQTRDQDVKDVQTVDNTMLKLHDALSSGGSSQSLKVQHVLESLLQQVEGKKVVASTITPKKHRPLDSYKNILNLI